MSTQVDLGEVLTAFAGKNSKKIIAQAFNSMDAIKDVTFYPDVKNTMRLTTLLIDNVVKPFSSTFQGSSNSIKFIPRDITVHSGKAEFLLAPEDLRQEYLAEFMTAGVGKEPKDYPFHQFVFDKMVEMVAAAFNDETVYFGVHNSAGNTAAAVTTGFAKHLADMIADVTDPLAPINIGALAPSTAYQQLRTLYRAVPAEWKKHKYELTAYMSIPSYEAYQDNLDTLLVNQGRGDEPLNKLTMRGTNGILRICPATWMGSSERVFITPKSNIIIGADSITQDLGVVNVNKQLWATEVGIAAALGTQFRHKHFIWTNEKT